MKRKKFKITTGILCFVFLIGGLTIWFTPILFIVAIALYIMYRMQLKKWQLTENDIYTEDIINKKEKEIEKLKDALKQSKEENAKLEKLKKQSLKLLEKKNDVIKQLDINSNDFDTNNSKTFILSTGRYEGGKDIPVGKYNVALVSGTGNLEIEKPCDLYLNFSNDDKYGYISNYKNIIISNESVLEITSRVKLRFYLQEEYNYSIELNEYEIKVKEIKEEIENLSKTKQLVTEELQKETNNNLLTEGEYKIGEDIDSGKYDLKAIYGKGYITVSRGNIEFRLDSSKNNLYKNLKLNKGSRLEIDGDLQVLFSLSEKIQPIECVSSSDIITSGEYKVGTDIQAGHYLIELVNGFGFVWYDSDSVHFDKKGNDDNSIERHRVCLKNGSTLEVDDDLVIKIYKTEMITGATASKNDILYSGKYEIGIDIQAGYYNLVAKYGTGTFELKPFHCNKSGFYEKFSIDDTDDEYLKQYNNILLEIGDCITINNNLELKLEFSKPCQSEYSLNVLKEYSDLKDELTILNNTTIDKYYSFSDYDKMSSQQCQNELILLKHKEKEMRNENTDIQTTYEFESEKKKERLIRQMLRCFNAECDNIIMNVEVKNIDSMKNKIQKSYETINILFSSNGLSISYELLKLKLEQATLVYTQMLKVIQEREIQQAIREQMRAEARAEREIEEQKNKIEKDLQQHIGQVNKLMKYLQKTQIDVEREMYIKRIEELESKIQALKEDKEKVLEREANAKAGFVYIISNIGSFGEDIYKIGMTRRLEPMDRIKELSSASVPFEFDVHAMIFSSDAPALENMLHKEFSEYAVNKINSRKEFFKVSIEEIQEVVKKNYDDSVTFTLIPQAIEYRQSLELSENSMLTITKNDV